MSRRRRGSLKGWWMYLPFVLVPFSLLFSEVWFQTQILNNEYRKNALRSTIRQTQTRVDVLNDEVRELARMERVLERAPDLGLVPPNPGQVVEVELASADASEPAAALIVVPVLAEAPKRVAPLATAKVDPPRVEPPILLEELEPLEPQSDWEE